VEDAFAHDGADDGVESGTISTTGEHSNAHVQPPVRLENDTAGSARSPARTARVGVAVDLAGSRMVHREGM
jgi:hypothetical protein